MADQASLRILWQPMPPALAAFRSAFLTASTWAQCTASDPELARAIEQWTPEQTVEDAIARLRSRRALERRGLLRRQASTETETDDD